WVAPMMLRSTWPTGAAAKWHPAYTTRTVVGQRHTRLCGGGSGCTTRERREHEATEHYSQCRAGGRWTCCRFGGGRAGFRRAGVWLRLHPAVCLRVPAGAEWGWTAHGAGLVP